MLRKGLCVLFVDVCATRGRCVDLIEMGLGGICEERNFRRSMGCSKDVHKRCMGCVVV